jgi:hypothetical protein
MAAQVIMTVNSTEEDYTELFNKPIGTVVKIPTADYETVLLRVQIFAGDTPFELFPITPGTGLFTTYGPEHVVITVNDFID